jgi:hypothetical protein
MDTSQTILTNFLQHLRTENKPFILRRDIAPPEWSDEALHRSNYNQNPELYALLGVAKTVQPWQRVRILFQLLERSRASISNEIGCTLERVTDLLLAVLHPNQVLTVFLALRRVRANHKHTTRAILKYILNHPQLEDMALRRRPAVVDAIEHALGKDVARACAKMLCESVADETYLRRHLLRFAKNPQRVREIVRFLYRQEAASASSGDNYTAIHKQYAEKLEQHQERPKTITATNRGDIAATLVHLYRGGASTELQQALEGYVTDAARQLPRFDGKMALVLDASASTRSYGDREYCVLAQSVALQRVLEKCCTRLQVHTVGGSGYPPIPEGNSDLATALLDALEGEPDLVAIVSDGYENIYPGDLERVVEALPRAGVQTPVVFCHSKFTNLDDLTLRRPAPNLPQLEFWHQNDFEELLPSLFLAAKGKGGEECLQEFLLEKLYKVEKEVTSWTSIN